MIIYDDDVVDINKHEEDDKDEEDDNDEDDEDYDDDDDDDNETTKFINPDIYHAERAVAKRRKVSRFSFLYHNIRQVGVTEWCHRIFITVERLPKRRLMQHGYSLAILQSQ